jgi:hypothetical protein
VEVVIVSAVPGLLTVKVKRISARVHRKRDEKQKRRA